MNESLMSTAYIGIGSNLGSPADQVKSAIDLLRELPGADLIAVSGLYRSAPMCQQDQPDYINAVAAMTTQKSAHDFLRQLQMLEDQQGRVRSGRRWEARILDLDLLVFGNQQSTDDELTLPHPGIAERNFVLLPWNEIAPEFVVPGLASIGDLVARIPGGGPDIERLN